MTILTSSFYSILQYYNNHHAHIEHTYYNIEQIFCQVKIKMELFLMIRIFYHCLIFPLILKQTQMLNIDQKVYI